MSRALVVYCAGKCGRRIPKRKGPGRRVRFCDECVPRHVLLTRLRGRRFRRRRAIKRYWRAA